MARGDALDANIGEDRDTLLCADEMALCEFGGVAYFELHIYGDACFELLTPQVVAEVVEVEQVDTVAILCVGVVALGNIEDIFLNILLHHKPRAATEKETFALSDGVEPISAVGTQYFASLQLHNLALALTKVAAQEVVVVYLTQETDAL